jgi:hypothetical protein
MSFCVASNRAAALTARQPKIDSIGIDRENSTNQLLYTRVWAGMTQSRQWLTTCCQGCVQTNCSGDFGLVPAASTPITGSANSLSILSPQRREDRLSTWAET